MIHYVAGRALGLDPGWSFFIATVPLVYLVARLPVSLGGLGFLELSFVYAGGSSRYGLDGRVRDRGARDRAVPDRADSRRPSLPDSGDRHPARPAGAAADDRRRPSAGHPADDRSTTGSPTCRGRSSTTRRSKVERYADLVVGERGWWPLLRHELVMLVASWVPGALGLGAARAGSTRMLLGACGRNVSFGANVVLRHPRKIRIGDDVAIDDGCVLDAKGTRERRHPDRLAGVPRAEHAPRVQGRRHRPRGRRQHLVQLHGVLGIVGPDRGGDPAGRLLLPGGRRPRLRPRGSCPWSSRRAPPTASPWGRRGWLGAGAIVLDGVTVGSERDRGRSRRRDAGRPAVRDRRGRAGPRGPGPAPARMSLPATGAPPAARPGPSGAGRRASVAGPLGDRRSSSRAGSSCTCSRRRASTPGRSFPSSGPSRLPGLAAYVVVSAAGLVLRALRYRLLLGRSVGTLAPRARDRRPQHGGRSRPGAGGGGRELPLPRHRPARPPARSGRGVLRALVHPRHAGGGAASRRGPARGGQRAAVVDGPGRREPRRSWSDR